MREAPGGGVSRKDRAPGPGGVHILGATGSTLGSAQEGSMTQGWGALFISQAGSPQAPRSVRGSQAPGALKLWNSTLTTRRRASDEAQT